MRKYPYVADVEYNSNRRGMLGYWSNGRWHSSKGLDHGCIHGFGPWLNTYPPHRAFEIRTEDVILNWTLKATYWLGNVLNTARGNTELNTTFAKEF